MAMLKYATGMLLGFLLLAIVCNAIQVDTLIMVAALQQSAGSMRVIPLIKYQPLGFTT